MIAGLPGTGLGGIFYILLGLWMSLVEIKAIVQGRSTRSSRQKVYSLAGISVAILAVSWLIILLFAKVAPPSYIVFPQLLGLEMEHPRLIVLLSIIGFLMTIGLLALLMLGIQIARRLFRSTPQRERSTGIASLLPIED